MKKIRLTIISAMALFIAVAAFLPASLNAQEPRLRNQNRYTYAQVGDIIRRAEQSSNQFTTDFRNQMRDNRSLSNQDKRTFNGYVLANENAFDRLRRQYNQNNSWWTTRSQVRDLIAASENVNSMMNTIAFRRNLERQWNQLRNDINALADTYDLPGLNGGGYRGGVYNGGGNNNGGNNGGVWNGSGNRSNPPSWAQGTFYGRAPDGSDITLTLTANGQVTAYVNGSPTYGTYYRGSINMDGAWARVTQRGNGIQTTRTDNGEVINYSRNGGYNGGGNNGGGYNGGGNGAPVSWAVGSFVAPSPQGGTIYLTVASNGQVTVEMGEGPIYGTLYGSTLTINGAVANVTRAGNGIRTTRPDNGESITYRRQ